MDTVKTATECYSTICRLNSDDVGTNYTVHFSTDNDGLIMGQNELTFEITGCPIGFGADKNGYICRVCDTFYYNIRHNFERSCLTCDRHANLG